MKDSSLDAIFTEPNIFYDAASGGRNFYKPQ